MAGYMAPQDTAPASAIQEPVPAGARLLHTFARGADDAHAGPSIHNTVPAPNAGSASAQRILEPMAHKHIDSSLQDAENYTKGGDALPGAVQATRDVLGVKGKGRK